MEDMVPELEDLEERGYFKKQEIKQIVKKRTQFEYLLKRPAAVKTDFLRCLINSNACKQHHMEHQQSFVQQTFMSVAALQIC